MLINERQDRFDDRMVLCIMAFGFLANVLFRVVFPLMGF